MTLNGAIKQLHELRSAEDVPIFYKPVIAEVINVLLMDTQEVRHGRWMSHGSFFTCSVCGEEQYGIDTGRYYCQIAARRWTAKGEKMGRKIDAERLIEAIQKNICEVSCDEPRGCSYCRASDVVDVIYEQPTVDAEPVRHGTWKERKPQWYCSACEKLLYISVKRPSFNYCPFCGAKMDGGEDG